MQNIDNTYKTQLHNDELDYIYAQNINIEDSLNSDFDIKHDFRTYLRFFRRKFSAKIREKMQNNFVNIVYLTLDCPQFTPNSLRQDSPLDFINKIRTQYPDNNLCLLIPIIGVKIFDKNPPKTFKTEIDGKYMTLTSASVKCEFFMQNKIHHAYLYKFSENSLRIPIYGIYSPSFSHCKSVSELSVFSNLVLFIKSARMCLNKLVLNRHEKFNPNIVHCENIPYYLGSEFEKGFINTIKVVQVVKDFAQAEMSNLEAFWVAINIADKKAMRKICNDGIIKKEIARLFNLHIPKKFFHIKDCIEFIFQNYYKFRKFVDKCEDIEENVIFNRLNARIVNIFPQLRQGQNVHYNSMINSVKRADYWLTYSKTYYNELFEREEISGRMFDIINKTKHKSSYISYGIDEDKYPLNSANDVFFGYDKDDFRETRNKNKVQLLKEFSYDRINTNFIDTSLFVGKNPVVIGYLDSFYDSPLLFANPDDDVFANGTDILFNTVLKLFELHKSVQVIVAVKDGLKNGYIKNWVDFMSQNRYLNGKWVFIDANINPQKFYSGADMVLLPRRMNFSTIEHYLAIHYGCIPVVSRNGILNDTVHDIFDDMSSGCGFKTKKTLLINDDVNEIYINAVMKALNLYINNPSSWHLLVKNCLNSDCSWNFEILEKYNKIYQNLI